MRILLACVLGLAGVCGGSAGAEESVALFNGRDLSGFYTFLKDRGRGVDPQGVFTVQDGVLRISGEELGCITTDAEYENYRLVVEFKWGDKTWGSRDGKARDSGVLLHSVGPDGAYGGIWMHSLECQLIEGGTGDFIVVGDGSDRFSMTCPVAPEKQKDSYVYQPGGAPVTVNSGRINWYGRDPGWEDVKGFRGAQDVEKPAGEWNVYEIVADGPSITLTLNGVVVNRCLDARPRKGRIQIQSEGAEIFFRRIDLTPIERPRRLVYNSDADNMFIYHEPPMTPADVYRYVDEIADAGATTLFMCPNYGMDVNYPSRVGEMVGAHATGAIAQRLADPAANVPASMERAIANLRSLVKAGHDPLGLVVDRARERQLETFLTFRLNEVHAVDEPDSLLQSRFWQEHPEWRIGKPGDALPPVYLEILGPDTSPVVAGWLPGGFDFAVPEVRARRLAELRECCERYDVDGLDLDFQRFPMYFKPGQEAQNVGTMTAWLRDVRAMTEEVGGKRGRPLRLSARVMARPEQNLAIGLDPAAWAKEGLVDLLTVSHYLRNDFPLSVSAYRAVLPAGFPVCASIEVTPYADAYRRMARALWADGADGIMLFNFFTTRERGVEPPFNLIAELKDPNVNVQARPLLLVCNKHEDTMSFVDPDTLEPVDKIKTGPNPHEIVLSKDGRFAYLSNYAPPGNTISVIDLVERRHVKQISTGEYGRIHGAAIAPDGKNAYFTAGQSGFVVEVDTATQDVTRAIPTHGKISHMVLVSPDDKWIYTANIETQNVSVIERARGTLLAQIPCGKGAEGMCFTPDGKQLWVGNQEAGSITVVDTATNTPVETFPCPGMPVRIRFTPDGRLALVPSWTEAGELVVLDAATHAEIKRIPVGSQAIGIELSPDGKRVFVGSEKKDGVFVVDLDTLSVVKTIKTGNGADAMAWWKPPAPPE